MGHRVARVHRPLRRATVSQTSTADAAPASSWPRERSLASRARPWLRLEVARRREAGARRLARLPQRLGGIGAARRCRRERPARPAPSTSSSVLSPSAHLPRSAIPCAAAATAAAIAGRSVARPAPRLCAARRSAVPQSGPVEPPTDANLAAGDPQELGRRAPRRRGARRSRRARPITIVAPWSPSPATASSRSSSAWCSSIARATSANASRRLRRGHHQPLPSAGAQSGRAGASTSRRSSGSTAVTVSDRPAISSDVTYSPTERPVQLEAHARPAARRPAGAR